LPATGLPELGGLEAADGCAITHGLAPVLMSRSVTGPMTSSSLGPSPPYA
jgi:hypothetical protein